MPFYSYLNLVTGEVEEFHRAIALRDSVPGYERLFEAPTAIKVINPSAGAPLGEQAQQVMAGYRKLEDNHQFKSEFTPDQIKEAWNAPDPVETTAEENQ